MAAALAIGLAPQMASGFPIEPLPQFLLVSAEDSRADGNLARPSAWPVSDRDAMPALPVSGLSEKEILIGSLPSADVPFYDTRPDQALEKLAALGPSGVRTVRIHRPARRTKKAQYADNDPDASDGLDGLPLRDFLRLYLNVKRDFETHEREVRTETVLLDIEPVADERDAERDGFVNAVLKRTLSAELADLLTGIFMPTLEPQGLIGFSIAGFGRFILLQTEGGIDVVSANTLQAIRIASAGPSLSSWQSGAAGQPGDAKSGAAPLHIGSLLKRVLRFVVGITRDPLSMLALMFLIAIWLVIAAGRRASQGG